MDGLTTYTWKKEIASYEVDRSNRLRLSTILRLMQESGDRQTAAEDIPYEQVVKKVCMVLISRSSVQVLSLIHICAAAETPTMLYGRASVRKASFFSLE